MSTSSEEVEIEDGLTVKREKAIVALLTCPSYHAAAQQAGVHPNTLRAWMKLPCFKAAFDQARQDLLQTTIANLQLTAHSAIAALRQDLADENVTVRQHAERTILEFMARGTEALQLRQQVTALEAALQAEKARKRWDSPAEWRGW